MYERAIEITNNFISNNSDLPNTVVLIDETDETNEKLAYLNKGSGLGGLYNLRRAKAAIFFTATVNKFVKDSVKVLLNNDIEAQLLTFPSKSEISGLGPNITQIGHCFAKDEEDMLK